MTKSLATVDWAEVTREAVRTGGLLTFSKLAWPQVEAGDFQTNWHHHIICRTLEKVSAGEIRKLVICVPPGSTKTLLTGVFWPAWDWLAHPERRVIHTTYGGSLSIKAARQMRDLVNSPWYQSLAKGKVKIPYQNTHAARWFENNAHGSRFSGSVSGEVTGRHAHVLVGDDLNKAIDANGLSKIALDKAWEFWRDVLPTRQADPKRTMRVLIGQRLATDDVPGRWMRADPSVHIINIPMWGDPLSPRCHPEDTREEGELMWPGRFDEEELEELQGMGPSAIAAQLQQKPIPPGGRLIKPEYLANRYARLPGRLLAWLQGDRNDLPGAVCRIYGDTTFKGKVTSDFTVFQCWVRFDGEYWLIDQVRGQWGFLEAKQQLRDFQAAHPRALTTKLEDAANAAPMVEDLAREVPGIQLAPMAGGCLARQQQVEGIWSSGAVRLPLDRPWMGGSAGFLAEHLDYDGLGTRHDDTVSTSGLALLDLGESAALSYNKTWGKILGIGADA